MNKLNEFDEFRQVPKSVSIWWLIITLFVTLLIICALTLVRYDKKLRVKAVLLENNTTNAKIYFSSSEIKSVKKGQLVIVYFTNHFTSKVESRDAHIDKIGIENPYEGISEANIVFDRQLEVEVLNQLALLEIKAELIDKRSTLIEMAFSLI